VKNLKFRSGGRKFSGLSRKISTVVEWSNWYF
jgi:hypothetical protein